MLLPSMQNEKTQHLGLKESRGSCEKAYAFGKCVKFLAHYGLKEILYRICLIQSSENPEVIVETLLQIEKVIIRCILWSRDGIELYLLYMKSFGLYKQLSRRDLFRTIKLILYNTIIPPVLLYGAEIWTPLSTNAATLRAFVRKVLRKIFTSVRVGNDFHI